MQSFYLPYLKQWNAKLHPFQSRSLKILGRHYREKWSCIWKLSFTNIVMWNSYWKFLFKGEKISHYSYRIWNSNSSSRRFFHPV